MKVMFPSRLLVSAGFILLNQVLTAQTITQLFGPINTRSSPNSANWTTPYAFGSTTISLTCPGGSTASLTGLGSDGNPNANLLVDNNIIVTVTQGSISSAPTNVCPVNNATVTDKGLYNNHCFDLSWENAAANLMGQNPDNLAASYGIAPFDFTGALQNESFDLTKPLSVTFNLEDEGGVLASSTVLLKTSCTVNGVTGPSTVGGNPITGDSNQGTTQTFNFNTIQNQLIGFAYDVSGASSGGTLNKNQDGAIPQVSDLPVDVNKFQPLYVPGTSFATSKCIVHTGEVLADGVTPACKLYALECLSPADGTVKGANCPVSTVENEVINNLFDGPPFSLQNIVTPYGIFRQGIGFLMAAEGWSDTSGGPCTFDAASGLVGLPCPQNLLTSFTGPGAFSGTGLTTNPNSTFINIYGVPQDFTLALLQGEWPNHWVNTRTPNVRFFTQAPNLSNGAWTLNGSKLVPLPGATSYVPAPIKSLTFGLSAPNSLPKPIDEPIAGDTTLPTSANCSATPFTAKTVPNFNPAAQHLSVPSDGHYLLHYYAQDCAGTQELAFTQDQSGSWMTNFFAREVNVDTKVPKVVGLSVPSPGSFKRNTTVYASYSCTDDPSGAGVVLCGTNIYGTESTYNTGTLKTKLNTSSTGPKSVVIYVLDGAGNQSSATVTYNVTN